MRVRDLQRRNIEHPWRGRALWWLHPRFAVLCLGIPLLIIAYVIPEGTYHTLYRTPLKHVDPGFLVAGLLVYLGFLAGTFLVVRIGARARVEDVLLYCRWVIWPLFGLTVIGYSAWFTSAMLHAGGPGALASALFGQLTSPEGDASYHYVKQQLFQTIPGVTTCTQFGMLYATVEALLWVNRGSSRRVALMRFLPLLAITLVRALLISERLALLELIIPIGVIFLSCARWTSIRSFLARSAPLLAGIVVFALFALGEYFRSWGSFYQYYYGGAYLRFAAERFLGYYATAINNSAVNYHYQPIQPLHRTLDFLFQFPLLEDKVEAVYNALFDTRAKPDAELLALHANEEFNNLALIGALLNDFTVFFAPVAAFVLGVVAFSLYRSFVEGRIIGILLYPSWFVGVMEISRIYYWPTGRYFPVLAFLFISLILFKYGKTPVRTTRLLRKQDHRRAVSGARLQAAGADHRDGRVRA